ncbi:Uncharacterised protein [uncultured archaeon]|nr:Uncharacterised protein [uncultured archaeon]
MRGLVGDESDQRLVIDLFACAFAARYQKIVQPWASCKGRVGIKRHPLGTNHWFRTLGDHEAFLWSVCKFAPEGYHLPRADEI